MVWLIAPAVRDVGVTTKSTPEVSPWMRCSSFTHSYSSRISAFDKVPAGDAIVAAVVTPVAAVIAATACAVAAITCAEDTPAAATATDAATALAAKVEVVDDPLADVIDAADMDPADTSVCPVAAPAAGVMAATEVAFPASELAVAAPAATDKAAAAVAEPVIVDVVAAPAAEVIVALVVPPPADTGTGIERGANSSYSRPANCAISVAESSRVHASASAIEPFSP